MAESIICIAAEGKDFATLTDLALPFSDALCRHLEIQHKQTTSRTSRFLDMLRGCNRGEIDIDEKIDTTVRLGFVNVIDAFHVVHTKEISMRFFHDERKSSQPDIRLTDELMEEAAELLGQTLKTLTKEPNIALAQPNYLKGFEPLETAIQISPSSTVAIKSATEKSAGGKASGVGEKIEPDEKKPGAQQGPLSISTIAVQKGQEDVICRERLNSVNRTRYAGCWMK